MAPTSKPTVFNQDAAETLALRALAFVAGDEDLLPRFLAITGMAVDDIKAQAAEPVFLGAVLDFLLAHEPSLMSFVEASGVG